MYTLNNVITILEQFANAHKQINSFLFQDFVNDASDTAPKYPLLLAEVESSEVSEQKDVYVIKFAIADVPNNENERLGIRTVLSDTKLIANDLIAYLRYTTFGQFMTVTTPVTLSPFTNALQDNSSGWTLTLTFRLAQGIDKCVIPMTGITYTNTNVVVVYDQDGNELERITAPGVYFVTVVSAITDTIDDNDSTITDPI